jgi:multimeric flavodoxin WrbA
MKAVILDGSRTEDDTLGLLSDVIAAEVERYGYDVESIVLRDEKIGSCMGCFGCWLRTPGICLIDDDGRKVVEKVIPCDLLVYLTPVTFGGYSSELKKAVDRIGCPSLLPFLTKIGDEIHHPARYEKTHILLAFGVLSVPELESERLFATLVARNAINMHTHALSTIVYRSDTFDVIQNKVDSVLDRAGVSQ